MRTDLEIFKGILGRSKKNEGFSKKKS